VTGRLALLLALVGTMTAAQQQTTDAPAALLRALDKTSGKTTDLELQTGGVARVGHLRIKLIACRFPAGNPSGDAFAGLEISEQGQDRPAFQGWMVASAPALSALDHPQFDVWVIRCMTP